MQSVTVRDLTKSYDRIRALKELTFDVEEGMLYGLIGPDGAGKTTFMRIATCLLLQDGGTVEVGGFDNVRKTSEIKKIVGYMPQHFSLYPDLSVKENLTFFADLFGVSRQERSDRIGKLLEFSRLEPFLGRRAGDLSGGMKQKLALSCALIHTPKVLFLDEPTTGVDPVSRREFWNILAEIKRDGVTTVVSTPYMDEAEKCDKVGFVLNGHLIMEGSPDDIPGRFRHDILTVHAPEIIKKSRRLTFPDTVQDIQTFGDRLHLTVDNANTAIPVIQSFFEHNGITNATIEQSSPSMEDVFMERMRE